MVAASNCGPQRQNRYGTVYCAMQHKNLSQRTIENSDAMSEACGNLRPAGGL